MSVELEFDEAAGFYVVRYLGEVDTDVIAQIIKGMRESEHYKTMLGAVWDFRSADLSSMTISGMQSVWSSQSIQPSRTDLRVASVFSRVPDGLILHLWQSAATSSVGMERRYFTDMGAARRWVAGSD